MLVLRPAVLELPGEDRLVDLAGEGGVAVQVGVLHVLLRDGAAALHDPAGPQVGQRSPQRRPEVDSMMAVEAPVLDGHRGLLQKARARRLLGTTMRLTAPCSRAIRRP